VLDLLREVDELEAPALAAHRRVAADDLAEAGGIDVRNVGEVQQDLGLAAIDEAGDRVAQGIVALADQDLAVEVQDDDVTDRSLDDLHCSVPLAASIIYEDRSRYHSHSPAVNGM